MIYTSYLAKLNEIPDDSVKILIMQWKGKIDIYKYNLIWMPSLSPSILNYYKKDLITKNELFLSYKEQLKEEPALSAINEIIDEIKEGKDVYLICCEKNLCDCHRRILAQHISEITNVQWQEFKKGE